MKQCTFVGTDTLVRMARRLFDRGEISESQMIDIEMRNNVLVTDDWQRDRIELG